MPRRGLTTAEARARLAEYGPNRLIPEERRPSALGWIVQAAKDPMVALLLVAGIVYVALGDTSDAVIALVAVVPIALVGLLLEARAERALSQLRRLSAPRAAVLRDGERATIPAEEVVPGDVLFLQEGDVIPADAVLVEGIQLMVDESALTGESQPAAKHERGDEGERALFAGTTLLSGRGTGEVIATGAATRYGKIGTLLAEIEQPPTPLQRVIRRLVGQLAIVAGLFCVGVVAVQLAYGHSLADALIAGISLAIAAIPEEFPVVFTLYLALGAWRLARDRALIRRLAGVETLGATTVICTDKTGTLTLGRVELVGLATDHGSREDPATLDGDERALLEAALLASEPRPFDPLELAIVRFAEARGVDVEALHADELVHDYPFDHDGKYLSHVWRSDGALRIAAKGSPEGVLERSGADDVTSDRALAANHAFAARGMRVLGVAVGRLPESRGERADDETHLHFLGLLAFSDPLRPGVSEALAECRTAGIRVVMITGDHAVTAQAVAEGLGLPVGADAIATGAELDAADDERLREMAERVRIYARTRPEQKHRLVRAFREDGEVVAMTGDGTNDAPALREADIGVAMGQRGTEVARAAATLVLLDDNFATIVNAVRDGRRIFENLRRAFRYLIAFHAPLLVSALLIPVVGAPLLLLPVHLVWLEILLHPTVSLVFEGDPGAADLMRRPPRPRETGLLAAADVVRPLALGLALTGGVLALYLARLAEGAPENEARAVAIVTMILGQVVLVLTERAPDRPVWRASFAGNRTILPILVFSVATVVVAVSFAPLAGLLRLTPLPPTEWLVAAGVALVTTLWMEPLKATLLRTRPPAPRAP